MDWKDKVRWELNPYGEDILAEQGEEVIKIVDQELDRAREEGYKKGREDQQHLDGLLYGTTVATTTTLEEGWILKDKKKVEEELSKLTTK